MRVPDGPAEAVTPSSSCGVEQLCLSTADLAPAYGALIASAGWSRRWSSLWSRQGAQVVCPVRDLATLPMAGWEPVRQFAWQTRQRHRPGLQYLVSTGRHHGFESIAEQRLLLALDFAGGVIEVFSQPFRLRYECDTGWHEHVPDFLAVTATGILTVDVRPAERITAADRVAFAATAEAAMAADWRYVLVTGWRTHVMTNLDAMSAQRRPLTDRLGLQERLLALAAPAPMPFGELVQRSGAAALARARVLHLIWHRRLGIDLARPLNDTSTVWSPTPGDFR